MSDLTKITRSHEDVDIALERFARYREGMRPDEVARSIRELRELLGAMFAHETRFARSAEALFGYGIKEVRDLENLRPELERALLELATNRDLSVFEHQFDRYTRAQWTMLRNYSQLVAPGAAGA